MANSYQSSTRHLIITADTFVNIFIIIIIIIVVVVSVIAPRTGRSPLNISAMVNLYTPSYVLFSGIFNYNNILYFNDLNILIKHIKDIYLSVE